MIIRAVLGMFIAGWAMIAVRVQAGVPVKLELVPHWKKGEVREYLLLKTREQKKNGVQSTFRVSTPVSIRVSAADQRGYTLEVACGETRLIEPASPDPAMAQAFQQMSSVGSNLRLVLRVSPKGALERLENWQDVRGGLLQAMQLSLRARADTGADKAALDRVQKQMLSMMDSEEEVRGLALKDLSILFLAQGRTYRLGEPETEAVALPSLVGGDPTPAVASYELVELDSRSRRAVLTFSMAAKDLDISSSVRKLAGEVPPQRLEELPRLQLKDEGRLETDPSSGWPILVQHTRTVHAENSYRKESVQYILQRP